VPPQRVVWVVGDLPFDLHPNLEAVEGGVKEAIRRQQEPGSDSIKFLIALVPLNFGSRCSHIKCTIAELGVAFLEMCGCRA
jgi:hypothetical protein